MLLSREYNFAPLATASDGLNVRHLDHLSAYARGGQVVSLGQRFEFFRDYGLDGIGPKMWCGIAQQYRIVSLDLGRRYRIAEADLNRDPRARSGGNPLMTLSELSRPALSSDVRRDLAGKVLSSFAGRRIDC